MKMNIVLSKRSVEFATTLPSVSCYVTEQSEGYVYGTEFHEK